MIFPENPKPGETFRNWTWTGSQWSCGPSSRNVPQNQINIINQPGAKGGPCPDGPDGCGPDGGGVVLPSTTMPFPPPTVSVGTTPPINNNRWFDLTDNTLKIWWWGPSGSGGTWVPVNLSVPVGPTPPASPAAGASWFDNTGRLWAFEGTVWCEITYPVASASLPTTGPLDLVVSLSPPAGEDGLFWLEPRAPSLRQWISNNWAQIGVIPPRRVKIMYVPGGIETTGTWTDGVRAGDLVHLAGCRGIDPVTNTQVPVEPTEPSPQYGYNRIYQAFTNVKNAVLSEGCTLFDVVRLMVFCTNMFRDRPTVNMIQALPEFWGFGPYPNRTIVAVAQLNGTDVEAEWLSPELETPGGGQFAQPGASQGAPYSGNLYARSRGDICEVQATLYAPWRS
jgi:enamine deaminase RidA (YjgF/YER057c/UK114 family)